MNGFENGVYGVPSNYPFKRENYDQASKFGLPYFQTNPYIYIYIIVYVYYVHT